jgi:hypothetical protein
MSLSSYILAAIVTYSGLFAGMLLAFFTEEELKPGRIYFTILRRVCVASIFALLFYYFFINKLIAELVISAIVFVMVAYFCYNFSIKANKGERPISNSYMIYAALAIVFYLSSKIVGIHIIISALLFIYGLPAGTSITDPKKKLRSFSIVLKHIFYVLIAVILKLIFL